MEVQGVYIKLQPSSLHSKALLPPLPALRGTRCATLSAARRPPAAPAPRSQRPASGGPAGTVPRGPAGRHPGWPPPQPPTPRAAAAAAAAGGAGEGGGRGGGGSAAGLPRQRPSCWCRHNYLGPRMLGCSLSQQARMHPAQTLHAPAQPAHLRQLAAVQHDRLVFIQLLLQLVYAQPRVRAGRQHRGLPALPPLRGSRARGAGRRGAWGGAGGGVGWGGGGLSFAAIPFPRSQRCQFLPVLVPHRPSSTPAGGSAP